MGSFDELAYLFELQFALGQKIEADTDDLFTMTQVQNKPLRSYVQSFIKIGCRSTNAMILWLLPHSERESTWIASFIHP